MEEQTEVIELRRETRVNARANMLWLYLNSQDEEEGIRFTQSELCEALGLGLNRRDLREAVTALEDQGKLLVNRNQKPHRYTLN